MGCCISGTWFVTALMGLSTAIMVKIIKMVKMIKIIKIEIIKIKIIKIIKIKIKPTHLF